MTLMTFVSQFSESFLSHQLDSVVRYVWMDKKIGTWEEFFFFSALGVQVSIGLEKCVETNQCYPLLSGLTHWIQELSYIFYATHKQSTAFIILSTSFNTLELILH